jgi:hypothetical protein
MSDGPHRSLPMRRHWRDLAERAATPAFNAEQVAEAFPVALKIEFREAPLAKIRDILGGSPQTSLFKEDRAVQLEAARSDCRGSAAGNRLIDSALEVNANGLTGDAALRTALENALDAHARSGCHQIEEHYRRQEPQSTADMRARLKAALDQCAQSEVASELISGQQDASGGKARLRKRTGIDEGPAL